MVVIGFIFFALSCNWIITTQWLSGLYGFLAAQNFSVLFYYGDLRIYEKASIAIHLPHTRVRFII